ncbi:replication-associated recombination protein A [Pontibacter sp. G13]|uniref:replication-associated recombination protein A n=1 Tax=Pontibacter sp. G13 TaxID=3074898 RepID=UPI00288AF416|nr:replication-associated recombination protein A [Pontibacter sp. G13]WNJ21366.1 replication-associated recombination protein A [Pontibacter sp. G13]
MDLFEQSAPTPSHIPPLAERMRPKTLDEVIGQSHLLFPDSPFRMAISANRIPSMIFWGPPGVGKTTLAQIVAHTSHRPFRQLSAISSGVKDIREVLRFAEGRPGTVLFIDEIHRFNKAQQDSLLGSVEKGRITLIGATTENPSFEVNAALLSRSQVYTLNPLNDQETRQLLERAISEDELLSKQSIELKETDAIFRIAGGDARKSLTLLEIFVNTHPETDKIVLTNEALLKSAQEHIALYDKSGEQHYDIISAFIKSIRGGDPNAAVYWLARMLDGGEDVKFIARRLIISASEDIGNANPNAMLLAQACFQSVNVIGMPEARIILSQTTTYLATSEKSNAAYSAINEAMQLVKKAPPYPVPLHLRNAPTKMMKQMGYGQGYKYSHDHLGEANHQEFLPPELSNQGFYQPKDIGSEKKIRQFLDRMWGNKYPKST